MKTKKTEKREMKHKPQQKKHNTTTEKTQNKTYKFGATEIRLHQMKMKKGGSVETTTTLEPKRENMKFCDIMNWFKEKSRMKDRRNLDERNQKMIVKEREQKLVQKSNSDGDERGIGESLPENRTVSERGRDDGKEKTRELNRVQKLSTNENTRE